MNISGANAQGLYQAAFAAARDGAGEQPAQSSSAALGDVAEPSFADSVDDAVSRVVDGLAEAETMAQDMISGGADPHSVVEALAAAEMALEMAVAVRDKVVEAYQEILRMPV